MKSERYLVVNVAALGYELVQRYSCLATGLGLSFRPLGPEFPAVTCTAQASFRTGRAPREHGMISNGVFSREWRRTAFWEQAAALLPAGRIWDPWRAAGGRVGVLFWQQSLGEAAEMILSPAPIHKHHGGMIQDCYAQPGELYTGLKQELGQGFNLGSYWGPLAGLASTTWIVSATLAVMRREEAPDLLLTYLPHLDYALQKHGPLPGKATDQAVAELAAELKRLMAGAQANGYEVLMWGDYAMAPVRQVVFPNRELLSQGWFRVRRVGRMTYPDLHTSAAFAMTDHQVAHVYVQKGEVTEEVARFLGRLPGVAEVRRREPASHDREGDLTLVAAPDAWFAYGWWDEPGAAPDYARHIDIHSKIGYDPCELFWGWPPFSVSLDSSRVRGSHGRVDAPAAWAASFEMAGAPEDLLGLSRSFAAVLDAVGGRR